MLNPMQLYNNIVIVIEFLWLRAPVDSRLHFIAPERTTLSVIINKGVIYLYHR